MMSSDSYMESCALGSTRKGTCILPPSCLSSAAKPVRAAGQGSIVTLRSRIAHASRTLRQYGLGSYSYSRSGWAGRAQLARDGDVSRKLKREYLPTGAPTPGVQPCTKTPVPPRSASARAPVSAESVWPSGIDSALGSGGAKPSGARTGGRSDMRVAATRQRTCRRTSVDVGRTRAIDGRIRPSAHAYARNIRRLANSVDAPGRWPR
mmetsp:Transcript_632/g.1918  ORF Transcript_632/g.1918 Transcript_632/m.1918 type:complete len:207 (-) Transcript_632:20-640(-)